MRWQSAPAIFQDVELLTVGACVCGSDSVAVTRFADLFTLIIVIIFNTLFAPLQ